MTRSVDIFVAIFPGGPVTIVTGERVHRGIRTALVITWALLV